MTDMTYFRIGVPNDMVADIMWHDDFEVSMEPRKPKPETNYECYFGTPERAAEYLAENLMCEDCERYDICSADAEGCKFALREWLEREAV